MLCIEVASQMRGPFVYRLGRQVFNLEEVRFPYGLPKAFFHFIRKELFAILRATI